MTACAAARAPGVVILCDTRRSDDGDPGPRVHRVYHARGIQAIIWNDVIQFCMMFSRLGATESIRLSHVPGGLSEVWQEGHAAAVLPSPPAAAVARRNL